MNLTATGPLLVPTGNPTPVEKAAVEGIADGFDPETFLWITFHRPDGGARVWYAWTAGGAPLGDQIDDQALASGFDAADWLHIGDRHSQRTNRGRIEIQAYALRPIQADIRSGVRGSEDRRAAIIRFIDRAAAEVGQTPRPGCPRWLGVGPALLARRTP
ncbi:hypothetical protein AB0D56_09830 [Streptomyces sp. NPDC048209]|uniref:hypothetical protein n=1 Tax=Streptomyces sp. NPDC048209 TaxID=3156689 RepID=UPI00343E1F78